MNNKNILLHQALGKYIFDYLEESPPNLETIANQRATEILDEIQQVFLKQNVDSDDFILVDELITILNHNGFSTGNCHDF